MIIMQWVRFVFAALLMLTGLAALLSSTVGLFRFRFVLNRIHAAAKCDTFGILMTMCSLMVIIGWDAATLKLLVIILFHWITIPVSSHLTARIEVVTNTKLEDECEIIDYDDDFLFTNKER